MSFAFEKLLVYQKSVDFADQVAALTQGLPRGCGFLADQLNRASLSIAANIAEGNGHSTKADRRNFFTSKSYCQMLCMEVQAASALFWASARQSWFSGRCPGSACHSPGEGPGWFLRGRNSTMPAARVHRNKRGRPYYRQNVASWGVTRSGSGVHRTCCCPIDVVLVG